MQTIISSQSKLTLDETLPAGSYTYDGIGYDDLPAMRRIAFESSCGEGSFIRSELWLPKDWNGCFVGTGNSGMSGTMMYGYLSEYVRMGYAVANTDIGTSRGLKSGIQNPDVWKDFGWRATHLMTEESKRLLRAHYGKDAAYSYFFGSSTGGQQAFSIAQRFPADYNAIIAHCPANNRVLLHTYFLWAHTHLRTKDGRVLFSETEAQAITAYGAAYFQTLGDGEKGDKFITYPYTGKDTTECFLTFLRSRMPLTNEQENALRAVYEGPVNPKTGERIYNGMPIGSECSGLFDAARLPEGKNLYPFQWAFGYDYDMYSFDYADDLEKLTALLSPDMNANDPDLSEFYRLGGKLLVISGTADPYVPYPDLVKYYNRVCSKLGHDTVDSFFRFFILPGKNHGTTGPGVTDWWVGATRRPLIDSLRDWYERGIKPEFMTGARITDGEVLFTREAAPYLGEMQEEKDFPPSCDECYLK